MNYSNLLIIFGILLIILGVMWKFGLKIGSLPGDIKIDRGNFTFYFPMTTSIIASIILTLLFLLLRGLS